MSRVNELVGSPWFQRSGILGSDSPRCTSRGWFQAMASSGLTLFFSSRSSPVFFGEYDLVVDFGLFAVEGVNPTGHRVWS